MRELDDFHHYRAAEIAPDDKVARCEEWVVKTLLESTLDQSQRDSSVAFELKHHHSVGQFARILARKRGLPLDACTVGALLHDVYVIVEGRYADHAHLGAPIANRVLDQIGGFDEQERSIVNRIVYFHSDKDVWSEDPFIEFGKDIDVLDCFLYPGAFDYYLRHKSLGVFVHYLQRAKAVWAELGIPPEPAFELLDGYSPAWLQEGPAIDLVSGRVRVADILAAGSPPFFLQSNGGRVMIAEVGGLELQLSTPDDGTWAATDELLERSAAEDGGLLVFPILGAFEVVEPHSSRLAELGSFSARTDVASS